MDTLLNGDLWCHVGLLFFTGEVSSRKGFHNWLVSLTLWNRLTITFERQLLADTNPLEAKELFEGILGKLDSASDRGSLEALEIEAEKILQDIRK